MNQKDKPRFTQIMLGMADNFRDTITKEGMAMRFDVLSEFSLDQVEGAAKKILRHRKYTKMPPVGEFFEAIEGSPQSKALDAWGVVIASLECGEEPTDLKTIETIRRIGGWVWLTQQSYKDLHWLEKRFIEHFNSVDGKDLTALPGGKVAEIADRVSRKLELGINESNDGRQ